MPPAEEEGLGEDSEEDAPAEVAQEEPEEEEEEEEEEQLVVVELPPEARLVAGEKLRIVGMVRKLVPGPYARPLFSSTASHHSSAVVALPLTPPKSLPLGIIPPHRDPVPSLFFEV
jgi:hypothetical protein